MTDPIKQAEGSLRRIQCLSGSTLKLIALVTMIIDHVGSHLLRYLPDCNRELFSVFSLSFTVYSISRLIGRTAFPIYCFLIAEGAHYTHSRRNYGINLLVFAAVSEIPWDLEHHNALFRLSSQNVFFTLLAGFLCICIYDRLRSRPIWCIAALGGMFCAILLLRADYSIQGMGLILLLYLLREQRIASCVIGACLSEAKWKGVPAFCLIALYNGERGFIRGKAAKYLFYAAYPAHILVIWYLKYYVLCVQ